MNRTDSASKITAKHSARQAVVHLRQSSIRCRAPWSTGRPCCASGFASTITREHAAAALVTLALQHATTSYGKMPYSFLEPCMATAERFDLKMNADEKAVVAKAAALMGTTMAGFVRAAAKEKAHVLLERETRLTLTGRDFAAFAHALNTAFAPNPALKQALTQARRKVRRA